MSLYDSVPNPAGLPVQQTPVYPPPKPGPGPGDFLNTDFNSGDFLTN